MLATNARYGDPYFEYRYHLIGAIPLILLAAYTVPVLTRRPRRLCRAAASAGLAFAVVLAAAVDAFAVRAIWKPDGNFGVNTAQREICNVIRGMDVQDVLVMKDSRTAEICAALDPERRYMTILYVEGQQPGLKTWDGYQADNEGIFYTEPAAVVCTLAEGKESLPYYLAAQCTEVARTAEHLILRTAGAPLVDGLVGLPYGTEGIDYPDSNWYSQRGKMDEKRRLHADPAGDEVLRSAALNIHTDVRVTLFSQSGKESGTIGTFRLLEDESGKVIAECPMPAGEAEATLRIPAGRDLATSLEVEPNCGAVVGPIYFEAETDEAGLRR